MPKKKKESKIFILDTNVILHDHTCIYQFEDNDIIIPITVLEELDKFKKVSWFDKSELPKNVSQTTEHLVSKYFSHEFFSEENILRGINK